MALYIPHSVFHLARLLYVRSETFGPCYVLSNYVFRIYARDLGYDTKEGINFKNIVHRTSFVSAIDFKHLLFILYVNDTFLIIFNLNNGPFSTKILQ